MLCPTYCITVHDEAPGDTVVHESSPIRIAQAVDGLPGTDLLLSVRQQDHDPRPLLNVGGRDLDVHGAEILLAELGLQVARMRAAQAHLDTMLAMA